MSNGMVVRLNKTMNQWLSHYVNAAGTNWHVHLPLYLMAYRATQNGSTRYCPFFLLHGREMIFPTSQNLLAKLAPDFRDAEHAPRLEIVKSAFRSAYRLVRQNIRKSHATYKRYYVRRAKERNFVPG